MSHTTTSTSAYTLVKYSRSYPSPSGPGQAAPKDMVWQHFVNPVIQLVLDVTKNTDNTLASVRLRIIWKMTEGQGPADNGQRDVIFEDLDLLSFSEYPDDAQQHMVSMQNSPLKAVYRDSIVGIRYLHPRIATSAAAPPYRRFQINFDSSAAAEQFIDTIRPVCPCKLNGPSPPAFARNATTNPGARPLRPAAGPTLLSGGQAAAAPMRRATAHPGALAASQVPSHARPSEKPSSSSGLSICTSGSSVRHSSMMLDSSSQPSTAVTDTLRDNGLATPLSSTAGAYTQHVLDTGSSYVAARRQVTRNSARDIASLMHSEGSNPSLPSSSPPSSSAPQGAMLPPPVPVARVQPEDPRAAETAEATRSAFVASLRESTDLYDLSRSELEGLVSHVIREPGFGKLLETLDSLWAVKGFLAH